LRQPLSLGRRQQILVDDPAPVIERLAPRAISNLHQQVRPDDIGVEAIDQRLLSILPASPAQFAHQARKFDRITAVAYDESWLVDAIVTAADANSASLKPLKAIDVETRTQPLPTDELYRSEWLGTGYVWFRKKDGQQMHQPVHTIGLLMQELKNLYPNQAA
jgi:hypothetical protein